MFSQLCITIIWKKEIATHSKIAHKNRKYSRAINQSRTENSVHIKSVGITEKILLKLASTYVFFEKEIRPGTSELKLKNGIVLS